MGLITQLLSTMDIQLALPKKVIKRETINIFLSHRHITLDSSLKNAWDRPSGYPNVVTTSVRNLQSPFCPLFSPYRTYPLSHFIQKIVLKWQNLPSGKLTYLPGISPCSIGKYIFNPGPFPIAMFKEFWSLIDPQKTHWVCSSGECALICVSPDESVWTNYNQLQSRPEGVFFLRWLSLKKTSQRNNIINYHFEIFWDKRKPAGNWWCFRFQRLTLSLFWSTYRLSKTILIMELM